MKSCPDDLKHWYQATVLLAVNVSYLAIPGLGSSSVGQISSLCSIIASVGCIVIGSLLASEHYTAPKQGIVVSNQVISESYFKLMCYSSLSDVEVFQVSKVK